MSETKLEAGRFVTVYFDDSGKRDGILLEILPTPGQDDYRVWFPHIKSDRGGLGSLAFVDASQIVFIGPVAQINIPMFG